MRINFSQSEQYSLHGRRVLIVDDNKTGLHILGTVLRRWGIECEVAASPAQALAILNSDTAVDCAILDFHMPEIHGIELARAIRAIAPRVALPLILFWVFRKTSG